MAEAKAEDTRRRVVKVGEVYYDEVDFEATFYEAALEVVLGGVVGQGATIRDAFWSVRAARKNPDAHKRALRMALSRLRERATPTTLEGAVVVAKFQSSP